MAARRRAAGRGLRPRCAISRSQSLTSTARCVPSVDRCEAVEGRSPGEPSRAGDLGRRSALLELSLAPAWPGGSDCSGLAARHHTPCPFHATVHHGACPLNPHPKPRLTPPHPKPLPQTPLPPRALEREILSAADVVCCTCASRRCTSSWSWWTRRRRRQSSCRSCWAPNRRARAPLCWTRAQAAGAAGGAGPRAAGRKRVRRLQRLKGGELQREAWRGSPPPTTPHPPTAHPHPSGDHSLAGLSMSMFKRLRLLGCKPLRMQA
jgi:hypothetical protein